jgi:hypothetical protein
VWHATPAQVLQDIEAHVQARVASAHGRDRARGVPDQEFHSGFARGVDRVRFVFRPRVGKRDQEEDRVGAGGRGAQALAVRKIAADHVGAK